MLTLIRENPALRSLPRWLIICTVSAIFILNVIAFMVAKGAILDHVVLTVLTWLALSMYLVLGEVGTRCTPFDMALPIPSRRLWVSHVIAVTSAAITLFVVLVGLIFGAGFLLARAKGTWSLPVDTLGVAAFRIIAGLILAVAVLQAPKPALQRIPRSRGNRLRSVIVVLGTLLLIMVLDRLPAAAVVIPLVLAAVLATRTYRAVPEAFALTTEDGAAVPLGGYREDDWIGGAGRVSDPPAGLRSLWLTFRTIHRLLSKKRAGYWVGLPFVALFGALLSGIDETYHSDSFRFAYVPMGAYVLLAFTGLLVNKVHLLDGWPLSPRRLFAIMIAPSMLFLLLGYGAGRLAKPIMESRSERLELIELFKHRKDGLYYTHVPFRFHSVAWVGEPPPNTSSWGESHAPWRKPLVKGSFIKLYSPYSTGPEASVDFAALQISRATEAIYGTAIPPDEIKARYLTESAEGKVLPKTERLTIQRDYPELRARKSGGPMFPVIISLVFVLWALSYAVVLGAYRAGVASRRRKWTFWGVMAFLLVGLWVGQFVAAVTGLVDPNVVSAFMMIVLGQLGESLLGTVVTYGVCAALAVWSYRFALSRLKKIDVLVERSTICL
jgi:hypothetical protein